jgi:protein TonB
LIDGALSPMRFKLPGVTDGIEVQARLVWMSESKKEAGVAFEQFLEGGAREINDWISAEQGLTARLEESAASDGSGDAAADVTAANEPEAQPTDISEQQPLLRARQSGHGTIERPLTSEVARGERETEFIQWPPDKQPTFTAGATPRKVGMSLATIAIIALFSFGTGALIERRFQQPSQTNKGTSAAPNSVETRNKEWSSSTPADTAKGPAEAVPIGNEHAVRAASARESLAAASTPAPIQPTSSATTNEHPQRVPGDAVDSAKSKSAANTSSGKTSGVKTPVNPPVDSGRKISSAPTEQARPVSAESNSASGIQQSAKADTSSAQVASVQPVAENSPAADTAHNETANPTNAAAAPAPAASTAPKSFSGSVAITMPPFPSMRIPAEMKSQASRSGQTLQMGQLISRVQPNYPQEAIDQQVQGTVKAHVAIGADGSVEGVEASGPALLVEAAKAAVQQWRYRPTLLNGQAIGADEDVTFVFRLNAPGNP